MLTTLGEFNCFTSSSIIYGKSLTHIFKYIIVLLPSLSSTVRLFIFLSCQASDWEKLQKILAEALEHYNELHAVMDLVLFEEAIQHV